MSLNTKRHQWMMTELTTAFAIDMAVVEKCFRDNYKKINAFLTEMSAPPKLFFFYQPRQLKHAELYVSTGEGEKLDGKCLWFVRNSSKPIKLTNGQDSTVICGEANQELLQTFESVLAMVYSPMIANQADWGEIKQEKDKKMFIEQLTKFDETLKRKIANLRGDIELRTPQAPYDSLETKPSAYAKAAKDRPTLNHLRTVMESWCDTITKYLKNDPSNTPLDRNCNEGPDVEIEYWSRRMLTLISITEQLKSKPNRVVTGVLKACALSQEIEDSKHDDDTPTDQSKVKALLDRWREVDLAITDALNEAKDNYRFLENLQKVIEPLYVEAPTAIADMMPALLNSMKMIHTLSRHYGTEVRMTNLFERVTNQLITRCKDDIYNGEGVTSLWKQEPKVVIAKMNAAIKLYEAYLSKYKATQKNLAQMQKGKQFNFDENAIFGKFLRFRRRLEKLIDMFSSIQQFKDLEAKRIDGMEKLTSSFDNLINDFKMKAHDLLDFNNTTFERDFVEFTMQNSGLENAIQSFMESSLKQMHSIDKKLILIKKFQEVLHRDALKEDVEVKYLRIFQEYGDQLKHIQDIYEKYKDKPPIPRYMTDVAGSIHWSRQLLRRITGPMAKFQHFPKVFHPKDSKRIIKNYNKIARILIEFETLAFQKWVASTDEAKRRLRSRLIVEDKTTGKLRANFDRDGVLTLMREARHLQLMGFEIPNSAKIVLLLEDKLKSYYNRISYALSKYHRLLHQLTPVTHSLLKPHLSDLLRTIRPAMTTMTWTSMNIEQFLSNLHSQLARFDNLVNLLSDISQNRIQKNLSLVSSTLFLSLPQRPVPLKDFVAMQRAHIDRCTEQVIAKNVEVERAVEDLISAVQSYQLDPSIARTSPQDLAMVKLHFCNQMYHALLGATKNTLHTLKRRVVGSSSEPPLFEVDLSLQAPSVVLSPSLSELQDDINSVARDVLSISRKVQDWGLDLAGKSRTAKPFYDKLSSDKNVAVVLLCLTGAVEELKAATAQCVLRYKDYAWLWLEDPENTYQDFVTKQEPILADFIAELNRFVQVEEQVKSELPNEEMVRSLNLKAENLKAQLQQETSRWKYQYSEKLHQEAKQEMEQVTERMHDLKSRLEREVKDMASLKSVMDGQADLRELQSWASAKIDSIHDRYQTLDKFLPTGISKDEMDAKSVLRPTLDSITVLSATVQKNVAGLQGGFKEDLITNVQAFKQGVKKFRADYDQNGPMVKGTTPQEAITRLSKYKREFETLQRKYELYNGGEKLFGLPEQKYPSLTKTAKELRLLDQLYNLYQSVLSTVDEYKNIPWSEVVVNIQQMNETVDGFAQKCKTLPKALKTWEAYIELNQTIEDFLLVLPLLTELSKPSMRDRHWQRISEITQTTFQLDKFHELKLSNVIGANLLKHKDDIEEITDSAEKQLAIEKKLREIQAQWDARGFEFSVWKDRGEVILAGGIVGEIIEQLEESQAALIQMLTQRHVTPFKDEASTWLKKLSDVNETLELWIKVQMLWMSLEAVFTGGDIARQMPGDTRVFMKVDKEWTTRLMIKAKDVKNVIECAQNEYIKTMLPSMFADLEKCQKALDGYLEAKRSKFPRFYFVSNPQLLLILSQGSDKEAVQESFAKIFDSLERVEFQGNNIVKMRTVQSGFGGVMDSEDIPLTKPVVAKGNIEDWLALLLKEMGRTMKDIVRACAADYESMPLVEFVNKYCAQASLLGIQFIWTTDVQEALARTKHNDRNAMPNAAKKQTQVLTDLSAMTTQDIKTKLERTKIETLVTIQVHQKDVLDELLGRWKAKKLKDASDFEWQKQLRCYWQHEQDECYIKIADVDTAYCYEYLGCKERLVVTPLTDRCYISLSQAIGMYFGGAPAGPAGTGKTETTKDLGRAYGKYVVVFNCSDQMHTADTAKIYKGLCQSGSWGCFDEFNRIDLEVLSVVAQQVQAIFNAMRAHLASFNFPGDLVGDVTIDDRCGVFITMNPGYAGRVELPENLKALFRGVAMMVPDREIIMKVKLASVGYNDYSILAKKFRVLYNLCEEQLSKQRHYDFGLRNILSVLRTAGVNLRVELAKNQNSNRSDLEEMLMMRTLRDMNLSKLVADDVLLFISLLKDLFPAQKDPVKRRYDEEEAEMKKAIESSGLIFHEDWVNKIIQLYETSLVRHGLMLVGPAGGGKSTATNVLMEALSVVHDKHVQVKMNPKAIRAEEMFGQNDVISGEWTHGIFSSLWHRYNDVRKHNTWIVCDGPVDAIWIENLNTVLDDNKLLTLANGDRIPMTANVRLLFEVENLRNASPATVSRAGIIFVSATDLGFDPIFKAWLVKRRQDEIPILENLYNKYIVEPKILDWLMRNTRNAMPVSEVHCITNCFTLIEGLLQPSVKAQKVLSSDVIERMWIYSLFWSLGGMLEYDDRLKLTQFIKPLMGAHAPPLAEGDSVFEYYVDDESFKWERWEPSESEFDPARFKFTTCLVPTVDSVRAEKLISIMLQDLRHPVLICGGSGTAKTSTILQYTNTFDPSKDLLKKVNFSSATTPGMFQVSMEADLEKRQGRTFAPSANRWMTVFLDDISMPEVNAWGDQPTLELVRQLIESSGFYFLDKDKRGEKMQIEQVLYVAAMTHPGGGRNDIPNRLKRHFFTFNMTPPSQASIDNIYGFMMRGRFRASPALIDLVPTLSLATIDVWQRMKARMLPTPSKFHYIFTMRDLSRVFQGVLFTPADILSNGGPTMLAELWKHECDRVFCDKLVSDKDKKDYQDIVAKIVHTRFPEAIAHELYDRKDPIYFVDFLRDEVVDESTGEVLESAPKIYEVAPDIPALKARVEGYLAKYNETFTSRAMQLVLFQDALEHMMRISRIIGMPRGNALLVGVGGSGRQSLARLAAYVARHELCQIKLTRTYKLTDFLDDIRKMYTIVGKEGKKATWVFTDFEILQEDFLEYVNAILMTGEVAGLFPKDERDMMCSDLRGPAKKEIPGFEDSLENLYKYFVDRIRDNLHIVLCFSPANEKFAERARRFPGLISCTTVDWFLRWPEQALMDVSNKFVAEDKDFRVDADAKTEKMLVKHIANVHNLVTEACTEYFQKYRRQVFVTPKSYLSFIKSYKVVYRQKSEFISQQIRNVEVGLSKLKEAEVDVESLKGKLEQQTVELGIAERKANAMLEELAVSSAEAEKAKAEARVIEEKCEKTAQQIAAEKAIADEQLKAALPKKLEAEAAANSITKKDIGIVQKLAKPPDMIKRIMDCVLILFQRPLVKVEPMEIKTGKDTNQMFVRDSYDEYAKKLMGESNFSGMLADFVKGEKKDQINEETMELLQPYLNVHDFNAERAKAVANAAEGCIKWVIAMFEYHIAALVVGPLQDALAIKMNMYNQAMERLAAAKATSKAAQDKLDELRAKLDETMRFKAKLEADAKLTQEKMVAANNLIKSLAGEKKRWLSDAQTFGKNKAKLVGDCALACAFVSYLGPFNNEFRKRLMEHYFHKDCSALNIPVTANLDLVKFLVDDSIIAEWNSQGLPKDDLSVQNGILVTQASRYPLLIDPQGQALQWLKKREAANMPNFGSTTLNNAKLRDQLEFCLENGKPIVIEGVVKEVDPMLDPVLEKSLIVKGRSLYVTLGDKQVLFDQNFRLFLFTKIGNPVFSPELSAKTTIIDFSVTQSGLEDQLLSRVIQFEQKSLEESRQKLVEEVNANTISLEMLDRDLLRLLSNSTGNLLDNVELIRTLANTKLKSQEVKEKIEAAQQTEIIINKKREQYRPVATRGSVLYFVIVSMTQVNCMYQNSLTQFLQWFDGSMADAEKASQVTKRVENLIEQLTFSTYLNVNQGLFEVDKLTFKLMVTLKIQQTESEKLMSQDMINLLLRAGAGLSTDQVAKNPYTWLQDSAWYNVNQLAISLDFFGDLRTLLEQKESEWKKWYEAEAPEEVPIPRLEDRLSSHPAGSFMRLLLVRSFRDDRTRLAANMFISSVLGSRYVEPVPTGFEDIWRAAHSMCPVILLLTPGADPTSALEELAKKKGVRIFPCSMGEGQEPLAKKCVMNGMDEGGWALLQNCHLGLGFMNKLEDELRKQHEEKTVDPNFRIWITCEPHQDFPINLLQMSIKVTNEPPRGMKAGLFRSYTSVVDAERLARVDKKEWRDLVFALCFMHSTVQERRKFGPVGWCIPYEFNTSDLEASLTFLEKHASTSSTAGSAGGFSWPTVQYMICEVQYGGRITDDFDRLLFNTYGSTWLCEKVLDPEFCFFTAHNGFKYKIPQLDSVESIRKYITDFPQHDSPEIFGLHGNAELTFGTKEAMYILNTISDTQPKESSGKGSGKTREEMVYDKADELLKQMPKGYKDEDVRRDIRSRSKTDNYLALGFHSEEKVDGFTIPLNIFLYQEITRLNYTIKKVSTTLNNLKLAINGEIIMTPELQAALNAIYDAKPPRNWYIEPSGEESAWALPTLSLWFQGLLDRERQLTDWLQKGRPVSYWLTGFMNPQGFLTATRQEITRKHKAKDQWALDDVVVTTEVTAETEYKKLPGPPLVPGSKPEEKRYEGVYIHGLSLEGAAWNLKSKVLTESTPKELFTSTPVILVSATTSAIKQKMSEGKARYYECPVYTKPVRKANAFVFRVSMRSDCNPEHWILRGVALLCSKD